MTFKVWLCASILSIVIGILLGICNSKFFQSSIISLLINGYVFIMRGIPIFVYVIIFYFVLPEILGISLSPFLASVIALGFCSSGYMTEVIRTGINTISYGQWETARTLGLSIRQTVRFIILPQMFFTIFPSFSNELESLIKSTAVLSTIGLPELTKIGQNLVARYLNPVPVYLGIACLYLLISLLLKCLAFFIEKKISYDKQ